MGRDAGDIPRGWLSDSLPPLSSEGVAPKRREKLGPTELDRVPWRRSLVAVATVPLTLGLVLGCVLRPYSFAGGDVITVPLVGTALHNLRIILVLVAGGLLLGLPTILVAFWNGFLAGSLFAGVVPALRLALTVHGVPELAGQFSATVAGLGLAREVVGRIAHERPVAWRSALRWALAAVLLTCLAAALESLVSPAVARALLQ